MKIWTKLRTKEKIIILSILLFLLVGIFFIIFLPNKEKIVAIQLEEICQSLQFYELDKAEWMEVLSKQVSDEITVGDMKKILDILGLGSFITFDSSVKNKTLLSKEEYYKVYEEILLYLDPEQKVKKQNIRVDKLVKVTENQGVICSETFIFRVSYGFANYKVGGEYLIYSIGMEILGCKELIGEYRESLIDFNDANIRVLLSFAEKYEWDTNRVEFCLNGEYEFYFNDIYIKDVSGTFAVSDYMKQEELFIHHKLGNRMEFVPKDESCRCVITYDDKESNPYRGKIFVYPTDTTCFFVNELPVEQYLYSVVPSEMPSNYSFEALKAQAVCARSFAYRHLLYGSYLEYFAHVDDTTNSQVYNKTAEKESTIKAVDETKGEYLTYRNEIATTYYFSTSCGNTAGYSYWGLDKTQYGYLISSSKLGKFDLSDEKAFYDFIKTVPEDDLESSYKYYRWKSTIKLSADTIRQRVSERMEKNAEGFSELPKNSWGQPTSMYVKERDVSGGIKTLAIVYEKHELLIFGEYNIRYCLGPLATEVILKNDDRITCKILPSAFFYITECENGVCKIIGGGYGHGLGLSQNGANAMSENGYTYDEIIKFYYNGCKLMREM